ncbi:uncharacterized protein LOC133831861 [Humulus lupulus]|uniref:uncharacterized protein LOC133831861 n=1 Tax=Humulus lupulus TaxID=3486 RepID=UPI002B408268|nr:uncharacterized protein LOC133831861 [Humulus lupulus]
MELILCSRVQEKLVRVKSQGFKPRLKKGDQVLSGFSMERRKKSNPKPTTKSMVAVSPVVQAVGSQQSEVEEAILKEMEEVFTNSMLEFPEFGFQGPFDFDETPVGGRKVDDVDEEMTENAGNFQSQARDKWSQFRALLPNQGGAKLRFEELIVQEGQRIAQVDLDEVQTKSFIKRIWGKLGIERIARLNNGFTLVNFRDEVTRNLVLEAGVLHFDRKPMIVKPWSTDLDIMKAVKSVPVWIRLPGLGLQYWGTKCLSAIMSTIGVPILVDKVTKDRSMMQFARVLVEIELSEDLPKSVQFHNEKGQLIEQFLEFEWLPTQCRGCKVYGHTERMCNKKPAETWRKKTRVGEEEDRQVPMDQTIVAEINEAVIPETGPIVAVNENESRTPVEGGISDWVTPKRVDGNKKAIHRAKNTLKNSYSALQDKVIEVENLGLTSTSALLETKLRGDKIKKMMHSFFSGWRFYSGSVSEGRLLLFWQQNLVFVDVLKETDQLLHAYVKSIKTNKSFCVTFVYGRNSIEERVALWRDLTNLSFPAAAWLLTGDFNAVFESANRVGGHAISSLELSDAQNWRALGLVDELRARGSHFTWTNKQANDGRIFSRLDRVFKNEDWLDIFPHSEAVFNWELHSGHCYCIIKPEVSVNCGVRLFRHIMGDVAQNYTVAKEKFQAAQLSLQGDPHSVSLQRLEAAAGDKLEYHARIYESFLRQKSKVDWLRSGDDNTAYFHACLKQRRASNCITSIVTETGQSIENFDAVVDHFVNHFQKIMGSKSMASRSIQKSCFDLGHKLTLEQQVSLVKPFSTKEVKDAFFSINSIKILRPDGFGSGFFKALWSNLETEISAAILDFFECGVLPEEINKATISLIPKIETPSRAADYRPIACCNSIYKCISKMLCSRLASVLPSLVNQNQGAFVKNRLLAHNILILQDVIKGYKRKNICLRCVLKIDLSKAYDMLDWNFLEDILTEFCFPAKFIKWLMACLKDPTYLILMNGKVQGEFRGRKGLRQGDTISPLLFVLAMEYCTRLFQQASMAKGYRFHPKCKHLKIVNLCFADDLVIFCKGVHNSVQIIRESFNDFCCASGLTANKDKSQVYFGGVSEKETQKFLEGLQFTEDPVQITYLGESASFFCGEGTTNQLGAFEYKNFWMSIFILPKSVTKEVDRLCRNFLRGVRDSNFQRSKMHFTAWDQVCLPKCMGGLGFKDSCTWNIVLLAKYVWAVSSKHDTLLINKDRVFYANVVWNSLTVPKHRFILRQATLGHLLTRDKLSLCHLELPSVLCLVRSQVESWLGRGIWPIHFAGWCSWMAGKPKGLKQAVLSAALAASVYMVWRNRNNCIFKFSSFSVGFVTNLIKYFVRGRLLYHSKKNIRKKDLAFFDRVVQM